MNRASTPTYSFDIDKEYPVDDITALVLTFKQRDVELNKHLEDVVINCVRDGGEITKNEISITLSQQETNMFDGSVNSPYVFVQIRFKFSGKVISTDVLRTRVYDVLNDEVL